MSDPGPVSRALTARNIPHRVFQHPGTVTSLEQAARERGQQPDQVVRSIVFRVAENDYVMVLIAGPRRVSWRSLRGHLGQSRLTTASDEEMLAATGYEKGAVAPFGLPRPMRVLVDERVLAHDEVSLGSGVRGVAIIMRPQDLLRALGEVDVGRFGEDQRARPGRAMAQSD